MNIAIKIFAENFSVKYSDRRLSEVGSKPIETHRKKRGDKFIKNSRKINCICFQVMAYYYI